MPLVEVAVLVLSKMGGERCELADRRVYEGARRVGEGNGFIAHSKGTGHPPENPCTRSFAGSSPCLFVPVCQCLRSVALLFRAAASDLEEGEQPPSKFRGADSEFVRSRSHLPLSSLVRLPVSSQFHMRKSLSNTDALPTRVGRWCHGRTIATVAWGYGHARPCDVQTFTLAASLMLFPYRRAIVITARTASVNMPSASARQGHLSPLIA